MNPHKDCDQLRARVAELEKHVAVWNARAASAEGIMSMRAARIAEQDRHLELLRAVARAAGPIMAWNPAKAEMWLPNLQGAIREAQDGGAL